MRVLKVVVNKERALDPFSAGWEWRSVPHTHTQAHTRTHTCTHTYTRTHTHTHTRNPSDSLRFASMHSLFITFGDCSSPLSQVLLLPSPHTLPRPSLCQFISFAVAAFPLSLSETPEASETNKKQTTTCAFLHSYPFLFFSSPSLLLSLSPSLSLFIVLSFNDTTKLLVSAFIAHSLIHTQRMPRPFSSSPLRLSLSSLRPASQLLKHMQRDKHT